MASYSMRWSYGPAVVDDNQMLHIGQQLGFYNPFDFYFPAGDSPSLYLQFASLDTTDDTQIKGFVERYGVLGLSKRDADGLADIGGETSTRELLRLNACSMVTGFAIGSKTASGDRLAADDLAMMEAARRTIEMSEDQWHMAYRAMMQADGYINWGLIEKVGRWDGAFVYDTPAGFRTEITRMRRILDLWRATQDPGVNPEALAIAISTLSVEMHVPTEQMIAKGPGLFTDEEIARDTTYRIWELSRKGVDELQTEGRKVVSQWIQIQLTGLTSFGVEFEDGRFVHRWGAETLLAAMYLMLSFDLSGSSLPPKRCDNTSCGQFFIPTRPAKRYCSVTCQSQQRVREWRKHNPTGKKAD